MIVDVLNLACATCANSFKESGGDAAGWAIMFMVAIIVPMAAGIIFFIARIARREQEALDPRFQDPQPTDPHSFSS